MWSCQYNGNFDPRVPSGAPRVPAGFPPRVSAANYCARGVLYPLAGRCLRVCSACDDRRPTTCTRTPAAATVLPRPRRRLGGMIFGTSNADLRCRVYSCRPPSAFGSIFLSTALCRFRLVRHSIKAATTRCDLSLLPVCWQLHKPIPLLSLALVGPLHC